jgi:aminoglycoside phosphotransferase (APT) family kinase protein
MAPTTAERRRELRDSELERLRVGIGNRLVSIQATPLLGGIDTATYRLAAVGPEGKLTEFVLRCYRDGERERAVERARRDDVLLRVISSRFPFVPRPVLADPIGQLLGEPVIVMTWIPGSPSRPPRAVSARSHWIDEFARPLATIHAVGASDLPIGIRRDEPPSAVLAGVEQKAKDDPISRPILAALHRLLPGMTIGAPSLLHHDYWWGNTVWESGRLTGVVDWSSARTGDPRKDLALARADLAVSFDLAATDELVARYEQTRGPVGDLRFWDLLWALVARYSIDDWLIGYSELGLASLSREEAQARIAAFAGQGLQKADALD